MGVSKLIEKELPESSLSHEIGETVERMIVNVIGLNDELEWIDIIIRDKEDSVVISIKNGGLGFHEDEEYDELKSDYYTLKDITDDIEYSKILGLNNTVITIKK